MASSIKSHEMDHFRLRGMYGHPKTTMLVSGMPRGQR
jgi:hypothetical protein